MRKLFLPKVLGIALMLALSIGANAQIIFQEGFENGIPGTWTLIDVDGNTPAANRSYVNDAWVSDVDELDSTNMAITSTSWYDPAGTADDWIISPQIAVTTNNVVKWRGLAPNGNFRDGYEVRISTTGNTVADFTGPAALTVAAENPAWTERQVSLSAYAGQNVYIAWRNNSVDMDILQLDSVRVVVAPPIDLVLDSIREVEYTQIPFQFVTPISFNGRIRNDGTSNAPNVKLDLTVYGPTGASVFTASSPTATLNAGASQVFNITGTFLPMDTGLFVFEYTVDDDTLYDFVFVSDSTYARDNGDIIGTSLGIGGGIGGTLGMVYQITDTTEITSISFALLGPTIGDSVSVDVYRFGASSPSVKVDSTITFHITTDSARFYTLPMVNGPRLLTPGKYFIGLNEEVGDSNITLATTTEKFTRATNFVMFPGSGGWITAESAGFNVSYVLRPNFNGECSFAASTTTPACQTGAIGNGTATAVAPTAAGTSTYLWNNAQTTATASGLTAGTYSVTITDEAGCTGTASAVIVDPVNVTVANGSTSACNVADASLTANATGGTGAYTYNWSTTPAQTGATATGLQGGNYRVTVTSAGCSASAQALVTEPGAPTVSSVSTDAQCAGQATGSITVTATGGSGTYNYNWSAGGSTSASSNTLTAGIYNITVTDLASGCRGFVTDTVSAPDAITITTVATNAQCFTSTNGSIVATISGGTGAYGLTWSSTPAQTNATLSNVGAGAYTLTVTDANGCSATATDTVGQPGGLNSPAQATDITCFGAGDGTATVNASGGTPPYSYSWTGGGTTANIANLTAGSYTVTVSDANGCNSTRNVTVNEPVALVATVTTVAASSSTAADGSATATVTGGTGNYDYAWNPGGATTATVGSLTTGTYTVVVTDDNGCTATDSELVDFEVGVADLNTSIRINAYPNPAESTLFVNVSLGSESNVQLQLFNNIGQMVFEQTISNTAAVNTSVDMKNLASGVYMLNVKTADGVNVAKIVKQ